MKRRAHSGTFFAVAACLLIASASGCRDAEENPTAAQQKPSTSQSEGMKGIKMQNLRVSATRWVLSADSAAVFREKKRVEALPLHVDFYEEDRHVSTLTAKLGILLQANDNLEARGQVRVVNNDGTVLKTEVLFWDHQRSLI
ncbi:MAG: LPS export ABC transporter periplasmic protein LptC, partial [Gemmatimonadetes bacterium]|nr:LPS export ABC transporter periplasmic protein LptC [Gemmatimonadota bacterium]